MPMIKIKKDKKEIMTVQKQRKSRVYSQAPNTSDNSEGKIKKKIELCCNKMRLVGWLVGFLTSSSTTRLYCGRAPRQSV